MVILLILLVTGAAGFIGSNFVYYYLNKYKDRIIVGLDKLTYAGNLENFSNLPEDQKCRFQFVKGDVCDSTLIEYLFNESDFNGVINFAAESHVDRSIHDPSIFIKTNVLGTQNLLDVSKRYWFKEGKWGKNKKFIQVSTDEIYGSLGTTGYFTEKTPLDPQSPYSASKASADLITQAYYYTYKMPINITRCSNNYGPYQFPEKLIPLMIVNALNHQSLPVYGDGKQIRDWLYVEDHCRAVDMVFEKGKIGEVYNIGGHNEKENIYIIKKIINFLREKTFDDEINENLVKYIKDRLGHDRRYAIDSTKIRDEFGWKPTVEFDQGMEKTINWYLNNEEWLNNLISGEYIQFYEKNYGQDL
jgi:dTDP-glucose 4,6-dehydratase